MLRGRPCRKGDDTMTAIGEAALLILGCAILAVPVLGLIFVVRDLKRARGFPSGNDPQVIAAIRGWSWGAFGLTILWACAHKLGWWVAAFLIPFGVLLQPAWQPYGHYLATLGFYAIAIYLGIRGNQIAWRRRPFRDLTHFEAVERRWGIWGAFFVVLQIVFGILSVFDALMLATTSAPHAPGSR